LAADAVPAAPAPADNKKNPEDDIKKIPLAQKLQRSTDALSVMRESYKIVVQLQTDAQAAKDVVQLECVQFKLTQIKGYLGTAEGADLELQTAASAKNEDNANNEYTKIDVASTRIAQLRADAEACIGQKAGQQASGTASVDMTVPADLPKGDPTIIQVSTPPAVTTPPPASPTL
jgi:hypothetical protein